MFNVKEIEVKIPYKEGNLYGVLFMPETVEKAACFICSHGIYSSYQMTSLSAKEIAAFGFPAVCFDFRGCSYSNKSGGKCEDASVLSEEEELEAVVEWMLVQPFCDSEKLYLLGQSLGGFVSALAGAEKQNKIAGMLLMYPAFNSKQTVEYMFPDNDKIPDVIPDFMNFPGLNIGRRFISDAKSAPLDEAIASFKKPVYLIHGTADRLVPVETGQRTAEAYGGKFVIAEGAEHGFNLTHEQAKDALEYFDLI